MNSFVPTGLQTIALDAYRGISTKFSNVELHDAVRNAVKEACGGEWNYDKFIDNRSKVYTVLREIMPVAINASLNGKFDGLAEFKDTAMGDLNYFEVQDNTLYPVYTTSRGNQDIERQKVTERNFSVPTAMKMIKFYDELDRFMAGKVNFGFLSNKMADSFGNHVGQLIYDAIYGSYASVGTDYKETGVFDAGKLQNIIENIEKEGNGNVQIWGVKRALAKISEGATNYSDGEKERFNSFGYYGQFRGVQMYALPQANVAGSKTNAINNDHIIIVPSAEPIVKVCFEGDAIVKITDGMDRNDMQPEFTYGRRVGAVALTVPEGKYGIYKFS
jgi:hypothetical protein